MTIDEQYWGLIRKIEENAKGFFKYKGSAVAQSPPGLSKAYGDITKDEGEIEKLVNLGVVPKIRVGSRSQGNEEFSTNFCLDTFRAVGMVQPKRIIEIVEQGITPFHLYNMVKAGKKVSLKSDTLVAMMNKYYGQGNKFAPARVIVCDLYSNHFAKYELDKKK